jgi:hypothetical protein
VLQENVEDLVTSVICGPNSGESLAKLNQNGFWVKMYRDYCQVTLDNSLQEYSGTWPRWGIMSDGEVMRLPGLVLGTVECEHSLLPTPTTPRPHDNENTVGKYYPSQNQKDLVWAVHHGYIPTPTANDAKNSTLPPATKNRDSIPGLLIRTGHSGQMNPMWIEWLMGFPPGWTE